MIKKTLIIFLCALTLFTYVSCDRPAKQNDERTSRETLREESADTENRQPDTDENSETLREEVDGTVGNQTETETVAEADTDTCTDTETETEADTDTDTNTETNTESSSEGQPEVSISEEEALEIAKKYWSQHTSDKYIFPAVNTDRTPDSVYVFVLKHPVYIGDGEIHHYSTVDEVWIDRVSGEAMPPYDFNRGLFCDYETILSIYTVAVSYFTSESTNLFDSLKIIKNIRIVPQSQAFIIERLGGYLTTWSVGLHVKVPLIDRVANKVSLKEKVLDFQPQPVITKDNVTMMIDTVIYFQITDPKLYTYGVENPMNAIENLSATTLRNIIGELELDGTLTSRDVINTRMRSILDEATDPWGIKVNRVEVKNILPPEGIREAMEKQMRAERERREAILIAEGEKQSAILVAEGKKAAMILEAEAEKEAAIRKAEGEAEAILAVQEATAVGLSKIKAIQADENLIKLRSLEAFEKAANGQATKIIIPSDIQNMAGIFTSASELLKK